MGGAHLDTLHLWRFGDYKHYTSLKLIAHVLKIPFTKDDIDRIATYCEKDVVTVAQVILRLRNESLLSEDEITFSI